jgi:hypothetical protein
MKYVITWHERPAASFYLLGIFKDWQMPASFTIQQFVVRWRIRRVHDGRYRQTNRHTLYHKRLCGFRIQSGTGSRCDGRGSGRGQSHRITQEKRSLGRPPVRSGEFRPSKSVAGPPAGDTCRAHSVRPYLPQSQMEHSAGAIRPRGKRIPTIPDHLLDRLSLPVHVAI